jgi:tryptophan 2,3-dioxygenase
MSEPTYREIEESVQTDLAGRMTYAGYLDLDTLLAAQRPLTDHHDELLFIVAHQVSELWMKLVAHELRSAIALLGVDDLPPAMKRLARIKHVQKQLFEQWGVLATLAADLHAPSLYDEFLRHLARRGHAVPPERVERDWAQPYEPHPGVVEVLRGIYADPASHWDDYEACEELVDVEESFQLWRFRHMKTVERVIGFKTGTGGSSGVAFLRKALELTFFPELLSVRTQIGAS